MKTESSDIIDDVVIRHLSIFKDKRGWLAELFRQDELESQFYPVMSYMSMSRPGEVRGPHEHAGQADLLAFVGPSTFRCYLWDNRRLSPTYENHFAIDLGEKRPALVRVPPGVVHAYKNIGRVDGLVFNAPNQLYRGPGRTGSVDEIRHELDPKSPFKVPGAG
ncbi:MAG: dTDP-4-dehydrorhamnose 3,5-epimerase family protein [bacterium]